MTVTRRLRYEVLRRDDHACRYCGAAAPDAKLTVDHVVPVALGGTDEPTNLVTACQPCNAGKSSSAPDAPIVAAVSDDALRWAKALAVAAEAQAGLTDKRMGYVDRFDSEWLEWCHGGDDELVFPRPGGWLISIRRFHDLGLPFVALRECVFVAMHADHVAPDQKFRYMCGVVWSRVNEMQDDAQRIIDTEAGA